MIIDSSEVLEGSRFLKGSKKTPIVPETGGFIPSSLKSCEGHQLMSKQTEVEFFKYFPGNYRWSMAMLLALGSAPWGGAEIGEVDKVGKRLRDSVGNDESWYSEWKRMGEYVENLGDSALGKGYSVTAGESYLRASNYYQIGERFRQPKDAESKETYRKSVDCFKKGARLLPWLGIENTEVPFEGTSLLAYMVHVEGRSGPSATVIFYDGLDISKELCYFSGVPELVKRGLACLIVDGPGNGETIRFRGIPLRYDYEKVASATVDYLHSRADVDKHRIGVMGISLGGYYATRSAAFEKRIKACVAWGPIYNYYQTWKRRIDASFSTPQSVPGDHIKWILGVNSYEAALDKLKNFTAETDSMAQNVECAYLLVHGENDAQFPPEEATNLFNAIGLAKKTLKIFTNKEGGNQHCQHDNHTIGISYISDWLVSVLLTT